MTTLLIFAFISGLVTIFAPCIWPLLPVILSSSTTGGKQKPLGITLGIMVSFAVFTLTLSYIVKIIPFDPNILRLFAVIVIGFLGLTLIIPQLNIIVEGMVSRLSSGNKTAENKSGFTGGFATGFSLGIVWSPCAGPIFATIATLAATRAVTAQLVFITVAYVLGLGIPLFLFATAGRSFFEKTRKINRYTGRIQQAFGVIMILTALAIFTGYDTVLQAQLLNAFPSYSSGLNKFENSESIKKELDVLKGIDPDSTLSETAPEFIGIETWLNTKKPLRMAELRGKVVLVDFWTYTCINCIRTLPYITQWHEKYKDSGLVIVGVHTPEFEFEKKTANVERAIGQYGIQYPVAQDNDFATWNAYNNRYWPAKYLIDAKGVIRYTHFGEGEYEKTERMIQQLLQEAGSSLQDTTILPEEIGEYSRRTPETYLGLARMERVTNRITNTGVMTLQASDILPQDSISWGGTWDIQQEYAESRKGSTLMLSFTGKKVFLVITPKTGTEQIELLLDGKKTTPVKLDTPRLYTLVDLEASGSHVLELLFNTDGVQLFAFTFE